MISGPAFAADHTQESSASKLALTVQVKNGKKVAKAVWAYLKHKKYPGHIDEDIANLIVKSTGLPALAEACL